MVTRSWATTRVTVIARLDAPSQGAPFGHAMLHAVSAETLSSQEVDRIERHHAVRAAAVRDDVAPFLQLAHALRQVSEREGNRAGNVPRHVLLTRPNVDQRDLAGANPPYQFVVVDRLQRAALVEVLARDLLDFGQPRLRQVPQVEKERAHLAGPPAGTSRRGRPSGVDETCASEDLQMVRGRGHALAGLLGERFDGPRALREEVEELEPAGTRGRLPDAGDLLVDRGLQRRRALGGMVIIQILKCILE